MFQGDGREDHRAASRALRPCSSLLPILLQPGPGAWLLGPAGPRGKVGHHDLSMHTPCSPSTCSTPQSPAQGSWYKHIPPGWSTHLSLPGSHTLQKMCKVSQSLRKVSTKNTSDAPSKPQRKAQVEEKLVSISCPHQTAFCPNSRLPLPH